MAHLQRLTYWLIAAVIYVLFGAITEAHAYAPVKFYRTTYNNSIQTFSAIQPACDHAADVWSSFTGNETVNRTNCQEAGGSSTLFTYRVYFLLTNGSTTSTNIQVGNWFRACYSDPMNGTVNRESTYNCTDTPPPVCEPGCNGACGQKYTQLANTLQSNSQCINSCNYTVFPTAYLPTINKTYMEVGDNLGTSCTPAPPEASPAPPDCPECECVKQGKSFGTGPGGLVVCYTKGTPGTPPITTTTPEPTVTNTPAPTPENPNPEPVTTGGGNTQTTVTPGGGGAGGIPGGEPQVTETTTNPDGSSTTVTAPLSSYCEQNPTSSVCKEADAGTFGGSCAAGFSCEGDAAQCAVAKKIHQDRCADEASLQTYSAAISRGEELLNNELGADVDAFIAREGEHSRNVDLPTELSETGQANLGGAGLADLTVAVMGQSVVIPFSKLNSILEMLGFVILAVAYVSALRIVGVF